MDEKKFQVAEYLDEPERILFFTVDEFLALMIPIAVGIKMHHLIIGLLIGLILLFLLSKLKSDGGDSYVQRILYWYLPAKLRKTKHLPPSYLREFIG